jgi:hypothetical protein
LPEEVYLTQKEGVNSASSELRSPIILPKVSPPAPLVMPEKALSFDELQAEVGLHDRPDRSRRKCFSGLRRFGASVAE